MLESEIQVKTLQYDGPLGLLLLLIQKEEMDIRTLDISSITTQYLNYLERMKDLNFDIAGDYLFMASTLMLIKSKVAIYEDVEKPLFLDDENNLGITTKAELIRRLEELQKFQKLGQTLWLLPKKDHEVFVRPRIDKKTLSNNILVPMDFNLLVQCIMDLLSKEKRKFALVKKDKLSIKDKLKSLKAVLVLGERADFDTLLNVGRSEEITSIQNKIITLLCILELARLKKINLFQNEPFENIYIEVLESLDDVNIDLIDEFSLDSGNNDVDQKVLSSEGGVLQ